MTISCRVCESKDLKKIFETDNCPKYSHKYLEERELHSDSFVSLKINKCEHCGTVQHNQTFPEEEYSSDYQRNISFSKSALDYVQKIADQFSQYKITNIVEIGCGNGLFADYITKKGVAFTGFEPSRAAANTAKEKGFNVHNCFFDENLDKKFSGYDGFAMRFVLEHLPAPVKLLKEIHRRTTPDAIGLIEVPNGENQIFHSKWYEFFREHTLYLTPNSIAYIMQKAGFEIIHLETPMNNEFIKIFVRKSKQGMNWGEAPIKAALKKLVSEHKKTYIWGASGGGITLIAESDLLGLGLDALIDSDKNKWGLYASGTKIKICPPDLIRTNPPDAIIILSSAYESEIKKSILDLGFNGKIGTIFPSPKWIM